MEVSSVSFGQSNAEKVNVAQYDRSAKWLVMIVELRSSGVAGDGCGVLGGW